MIILCHESRTMPTSLKYNVTTTLVAGANCLKKNIAFGCGILSEIDILE